MNTLSELTNLENTEFSNFVIGTMNLGSGGLVPIRVGGQFEYFSSADADDDLGEADTTEPSGDDISLSAGEEYLAPKLKQLVREKKLAMKAQYGKGSIELTHQECKQLPYPCPTWKEPFKVCKKNVCAPVPTVPPKRKRGWRYYWKQFKKDGGKAQLKQMAKNLVPYVSPTTGLPANPPVVVSPVTTLIPIITPSTQPITEVTPPVIETGSGETKKETEKFAGDSIKYPLIIAGVIVVAIGGFFLYKYIRNKRATA